MYLLSFPKSFEGGTVMISVYRRVNGRTGWLSVVLKASEWPKQDPVLSGIVRYFCNLL